MVVFGELSMGQSNLVSMYYGDRWRIHRKLTHMGVGLQLVRSYSGFQNSESKVVALDLVKDPSDYVMHFERYAASVVSIIGFNRRIRSNEDPIITDVIALMQKAAELNVPGKSFPMLMETFPCKWTRVKLNTTINKVQSFQNSPTGWLHGNTDWVEGNDVVDHSTSRWLKKPSARIMANPVTRRNSSTRRRNMD